MGIVDGTSGNDQIDVNYLGDPDGDRVDNNDAIRPGTTGNDDVIDAGAGDDYVAAGDGNDWVAGGNGDDTLDGGAGADTLLGGAGSDTFIAGAGDIINGGRSDDDMDVIDLRGLGAYRIEGLSPSINGNGFAGTVILINASGATTGRIEFSQIEAILGDSSSTPVLLGESNLDGTVEGTAGDDLIDAAYTGDPEGDRVDNNDAIQTGSAPNDDLILAGAGNDSVLAGAGSDTVYGGEGDDALSGNAGADTLYGGRGDDILSGGEGNDVLIGGAGADTLTGGAGSDVIIGGAGRDVILGGTGGDVVDGGACADDFDTLNLSGSGVDFVTYLSNDREDGIVTFLDGSTMTFSEIENVVPCFTPGTTIATPRGERPVEDLRVGDRIITRDNGIQEIRWIGRKDMKGNALVKTPHLRPVMIKAGALGNGLPERDMLVSPNHRLLISNDRTQLYFEENEVLAAAKHLVGTQGVHSIDVVKVSYIHMMFDRHEVVLSNGSWTESFQPGDYSLKGIGNAQRNEIMDLFPELQTAQGIENFMAARRTLKKHEAMLLVQ